MYKLIILFLFFSGTLTCPGQNVENIFGDPDTTVYDDAKDQPETRPDTVLLKNTSFLSPDSVEALKQKKEFAYVPVMDSLLKAQGSKSVSNVAKPLSIVERFLNSAFFRFFIWLIPITLVLLVIFNLLKSRGVFRKKMQARIQEEGEEDLPTTNHDYRKLARNSANTNNFRLAVKYLFLHTLKQLTEAGSISYALDKTNYKYVQEISPDKRQEFARLVLNYEYVWYGNSILDKLMYTKIENEFNTFFQKYNLS